MGAPPVPGRTRVATAALVGLAVTLLLLLLPPAAGAATPAFRFGVAAGDVGSFSAILWGRATLSSRVVLDLSRSRRFPGCGARRAARRPRRRARRRAPAFTGQVRRRCRSRSLIARRSRNYTVQARVRRLRSGTRYYYRFRRPRRGRDPRSATGTFVTAPRRSVNATIRFAYSGDADAQPAPGEREPYYNRFGAANFGVYKAMMAERNHFNVNLGDTIYSDTEVGASVQGGVFRPATDTALTRREKWAKYRMNLALPNLQRLRGSTAFYSHPDDHEFVNDFGPDETLTATDANGREIHVSGRSVYLPGVQAFRDYSPVSWSEDRGFYRVFHWGRNLDVFFLDERSFRSAKAGSPTIHTCDNPETGEPDIAPTAPPDKRQLFSLFIESLDQPVSQRCTDTIHSPARSMLGLRQRNDFLGAVRSSRATWKVIMNEVPILQWYGLPYDRWEGYEFERKLLLRELMRVPNTVFLSTDLHAAFVNVIRFETFLSEGGPQDSGLYDFVIGPVATRTFRKEINAAVGGDPESGNAGQTFDDAFFEPPPDAGLGMHPAFAREGRGCTANDVFNYGQVTVTRNTLTIQPKDLNREPVREENEPRAQCGPYVLRAR